MTTKQVDLKALEHVMKVYGLVANEKIVMSLIEELRAARAVVEEARSCYNSPALFGTAFMPLDMVLEAYDKVVGK